MKMERRITSQVTANIIDDFQNRYLSEAQYINYKVISQSRSRFYIKYDIAPENTMKDAVEKTITKTKHNGL